MSKIKIDLKLTKKYRKLHNAAFHTIQNEDWTSTPERVGAINHIKGIHPNHVVILNSEVIDVNLTENLEEILGLDSHYKAHYRAHYEDLIKAKDQKISDMDRLLVEAYKKIDSLEKKSHPITPKPVHPTITTPKPPHITTTHKQSHPIASKPVHPTITTPKSSDQFSDYKCYNGSTLVPDIQVSKKPDQNFPYTEDDCNRFASHLEQYIKSGSNTFASDPKRSYELISYLFKFVSTNMWGYPITNTFSKTMRNAVGREINILSSIDANNGAAIYGLLLRPSSNNGERGIQSAANFDFKKFTSYVDKFIIYIEENNIMVEALTNSIVGNISK